MKTRVNYWEAILLMAIVVGCSYLISSCTNELDAIEDEDRVE